MQKVNQQWAWLWVLAAGLLLLSATRQGGCGLAFVQKPTAATYVYEKDDTAIPAGVESALDKLNRQGIVATVFEQDTTDGTGQTPSQYKAALDAAKKVGLPSLVTTAGDRVLRVAKNPQTEDEVLGVAK